MAQLPQTFDPSQYRPQYSMPGGLPVGLHKLAITASDWKATSDGKGNNYMALTMQVLEGPSAGMTGIDRLNLMHSDQATVTRAYGQLSAYCKVIGVPNAINDSSVLHNQPFLAHVVLQPGDNPRGYTQIQDIYTVNGLTVDGKAMPAHLTQGASQAGHAPQQQQPAAQWQQPNGQAPLQQQQPQQPAQQQPFQQQPQQQPFQQQPQQAFIPQQQQQQPGAQYSPQPGQQPGYAPQPQQQPQQGQWAAAPGQPIAQAGPVPAPQGQQWVPQGQPPQGAPGGPAPWSRPGG